MLAEIQKSTPEEDKEQREILGAWLKSLRKSEGMTQRNLADRLSLDYYQFISLVENGRTKVPPHLAREWALALGQDPKSFTQELLRCYDPLTYQNLFEDKGDSDPDDILDVMREDLKSGVPELMEGVLETMIELETMTETLFVKAETKMLLRLLEHRFGKLPDPVKSKIDGANRSQINRWFHRGLEAKNLEVALG